MRLFPKKRIVVPSHFSLNDKQAQKRTLQFLNRLSNISADTVELDVSRIQKLDQDGMLVLLANIEIAREHKKWIYRGTALPSKLPIKTLILSRLQCNHQRDESAEIFSKKHMTVPPTMAEKAVKELHRIGINNYPPVYEIMMELMTNAVEHGNINWWFTSELQKENKKRFVRYTFLDMGSGIVNSYKKSKIRLNLCQRLFQSQIVMDALEGKLPSTTGNPDRGKGLSRFVHKFVQNNHISSFILITNNVSLCYEDGKFNTKRVPKFDGTYYSWIVSKDNSELWQQTLK